VKRPFTLIDANPSRETIECLGSLLDDAKAGKMLGVAFVAMYKGRTFIAKACGEAHRSPVFTRGMLRSLDDELRRLMADEQ
jgi:hypothetical protein